MVSCITKQKVAIKKHAKNQPAFLGSIGSKIADQSSDTYALYTNKMITNLLPLSDCQQTESLIGYIPSGVCGNGVLDEGEECDFGVEENGGICKSDCTIDCAPGGGHRSICAAAGDFPTSMCQTLTSYVYSVEGAANFNAGDCATFSDSYINSTLCDRMQLFLNNCPGTPSCGNGITEVGESCDYGALNGIRYSICQSDCYINCTLLGSPDGENSCQASGTAPEQCAAIGNYLDSLGEAGVDGFDFYSCKGFVTNLTNICSSVETLTKVIAGLDSCASNYIPG